MDNTEVDFIASKMEERLYVQVTESMLGEDVRRRELAPLQKINDNYETDRGSKTDSRSRLFPI